MSILVVSPHLDDAILSVGAAIAAEAHEEPITVLTVLAQIPPVWVWPTPFDSASGFEFSHKAVVARRQEDARACRLVGARAEWLHFLDGQYGIEPLDEAVECELRGRFSEPEDAPPQIAVPLGLLHPDHRKVARWCRAALTATGQRTVTVYADLPGAVLEPGHVRGAVRGWERAGWRMEPMTWVTDLHAKRRAREEYVSQLRFPELAWENLTEEHGWTASRED